MNFDQNWCLSFNCQSDVLLCFHDLCLFGEGESPYNPLVWGCKIYLCIQYYKIKCFFLCRLGFTLQWAGLFVVRVWFPHIATTMNQHPVMHHEGWMASGQEIVFCCVPVPKLTMVVSLVAFFWITYLLL